MDPIRLKEHWEVTHVLCQVYFEKIRKWHKAYPLSQISFKEYLNEHPFGSTQKKADAVDLVSLGQ